jgi:hypothetical protein
MRVITICAILLASLPSWAAEDGYVYGDNHCFYFSAPSGWVADHISGRNQGLAFVFYPKGSSWANATTVIYARVADKMESLKEPKDQVARTLQQFRTEYQDPDVKVQRVGTIEAATGAVSEIYRFSGGKWGNTELVAYFNGKKTINFFVMNSRDTEDLDKNRKAIEELARSYREGEDCKPCPEAGLTSPCGGYTEAVRTLPNTLDEAIALGRQHEDGEATRDYHRTALMPYFGTKYADIFKHCFDTLSKPDDRAFTFVAAIDSQGRVLKVYRNIETNIFQCMNERLTQELFPLPPVTPYFLHIDVLFAK